VDRDLRKKSVSVDTLFVKRKLTMRNVGNVDYSTVDKLFVCGVGKGGLSNVHK
jgi:hypothetical protein